VLSPLQLDHEDVIRRHTDAVLDGLTGRRRRHFTLIASMMTRRHAKPSLILGRQLYFQLR